MPVLRLSEPVTPSVPELEVFKVNAPLLLSLPTPLVIEILPPLADSLRPACIVTRPDAPLEPRAMSTLKLPLVPLCANSEAMAIDPDVPNSEIPLRM